MRATENGVTEKEKKRNIDFSTDEHQTFDPFVSTFYSSVRLEMRFIQYSLFSQMYRRVVCACAFESIKPPTICSRHEKDDDMSRSKEIRMKGRKKSAIRLQ